MSEQEKLQIVNLLTNLEESKKYIPYFSDLEMHPVFWGVITSLSDEQKLAVQALCEEYVVEKLGQIKKTKWGQLFNRFFESQNDLFWTFRRMNDKSIQHPDFQKVWNQVELEMFKLEGILTEKMLKQEKGLEQVIGSFYNIVYLFFPRYNEIGE